ncbi:MAG: response regulator [Bacteroidota bacterium]
MNILVVDNHELILDSIKVLLNENFPNSKIWTAQSSLVANDLIRKNTFDLIICDYKIDEHSGLDIFHNLKNLNKKTKFLIVSMINDPIIITTLLEHGINGFVCKEGSKNELVKAVIGLQENKKFICQSTQTVLKGFKKNLKDRVFFTKREFEIIRLIMKEYKNQDIAKELSISVSTVETHKKNLITKLQVKGTVGLVKYVIENQLI